MGQDEAQSEMYRGFAGWIGSHVINTNNLWVRLDAIVPPGLVEGTETVIFYSLFLLYPGHYSDYSPP